MIYGPETKATSDKHFAFHNNLTSPDDAVRHTSDNTTCETDEDHEQILIDLHRPDKKMEHVVFTVSIHNTERRGQNFGQVSEAFIPVVDNLTGPEMCRYELSYDATGETATVFGALYRRGEEWKSRTIGQGGPRLSPARNARNSHSPETRQGPRRGAGKHPPLDPSRRGFRTHLPLHHGGFARYQPVFTPL
ncbi:TerD family protein [Streptomyces sp. NPDC056701]|uniref:TerD family protein n=1 Tax=Streptomyces sp. NPDC056701 TaxID=3345916 RepID=UPI0036BE3A0A